MFDRISSEYWHKETAIARVSVIDQHYRAHRAELEILINRSATMRPLKPRPRGHGLFEPREESESQRSLDFFTDVNSIKARALTVEVETRGS